MNAPSLCSVSGGHGAIAVLARELADAGVEHRMLHTSHAFHSAMMEPALAPFGEIVARVSLSAPRRPYVSNVTGTWIRPEQATSPEYYVDHLRASVLFAGGIATLAADPSLLLLEVGPGTALSSLARLTIGRDGSARVVSSLPHPREKRAQVGAMMAAAARLWTAGATVNWEGMHRDEQLHRVALPSYPFERKRHWVDAPRPVAEETSTRVDRRTEIKDWFHVPTWALVPIAATTRRAIDGAWLVFGGADALTAQAASGLRSRGATVAIVREGASFAACRDDHYSLRRDADDDYGALFGDLRRRGLRLRGVVHLWNVGATDSHEEEPTRPLHALMALGRALIREAPSAPVRVIVATTGAQSVLGEAVSVPGRALVAGPVLALPAEHDSLRLTAIDLADPHGDAWTGRAAEALLDEATADDAEPFVAWRAGVRWARRYSESTLPAIEPHAMPLKARGVYLVTGGTGGIGLTLAAWLAARISARLLLTARKELPARDTWDGWLAAHDAGDQTAVAIANVRRIEAAGGEVLVMAADVADEDAMRRAVDAARARWGSVDGVIHSAGVPGGAAVAFSDQTDTDAVLRPKINGTRVLARLFEKTPLDFFAVFSSVSAVVGSPGSCAYAAACAYLDAFALSSHRPPAWRQTLSIAWDAWRDIGMAERVVVPMAMRAARRAYVAAGITPAEGAEAFGRALAAGLPQYVISPYEIDRILSARRRAASLPEAAPSRAVEERDSAAAPSTRPERAFDAPAGAIEESLASIWEDLLGVHPVGAGDNFFELGGHSLLATRVLARIDDHFGVRLPLRAVFEAPTVRQLGELLAVQGRDQGSAVVIVPSGEREEFEL